MTTSLDILVRARDEASATLNKVSSSTKGVGAAATSAGKSTSKLDGFFKSTAGSLAGMVGGAVLAQKAFAFLGDSIEAAEEADAAVDGLRASLNSMGRDLSADIFTKQASDLQALTGMSDEEIIAGQGLLSTFKGISDELLTNLTPAMVDFAARFTGGNIESAARLMGKALNDPAEGLTKLSRVGVIFTEGQKDQITAMVESGDVMGAQKIMLAELSRETKGFAEATATASDKMKAAWSEFEEFVGAKLLPAFGATAEGVTSILTAINEGDGVGTVQAFGTSLLNVAPTVSKLIPVLGAASGQFQDIKDSMTLDERTEAFNTANEKLRASLGNGSVTRAEAIQQLDDLREVTGIELPKASAEYVDAVIKEDGIVTTSTGKLADNTKARQMNAQEIRDQQQAMLGSIDANFAVADAISTVTEAEQKVDAMRRRGITDGKKYEEATRAVADAHLTLQGALLAQEQANKDAQLSGKDARQATIDWGKSIGLTKGDVLDLLPKIKDYNHELDSIPAAVSTTITYDVQTHGKIPPLGGNPNLHPEGEGATGGIVRRPTFALIGERGPEAVIPLNRTRGNGPLPTGGGLARLGSGRTDVRLILEGGVSLNAYIEEVAAGMAG